jgi:hypothetical protein
VKSKCFQILFVVANFTLPIQGLTEVFFDDSFEYSSYSELLLKTETKTNWQADWGGVGQGQNIELTSTQSKFGNQSLKLNFTTTNIGEGPNLVHSFNETDHLFFRFYWKASKDFTFSGSGTKILGFFGFSWPNAWIDATSTNGDPNNGDSKTADLVLWVQGEYDMKDTVGVGMNTAIASDTWYCIQGEWKLNTPGFPDGYIKMTVNGVQTSYSGKQFRGPTPSSLSGNGYLSPSNANFSNVNIYQERGIGSTYYDQIAFGNEYIPCSPTVTSPTPTPTKPLAPRNLKVN